MSNIMNRSENKGEQDGKRSILKRFTKNIQFPNKIGPGIESIKFCSQSCKGNLFKGPSSSNHTKLSPTRISEFRQRPSGDASRLRNCQEKKKKVWRVTELELSNNHLIKELQRTQRVLELALSKISNGETSIDVAGEFLKQQIYLKFLQKENAKFHLIFDSSSHVNNDKFIISRMAEKVISLQEENLRLQEEIAKQTRTSFFLATSSEKLKRKHIIRNIYRACCLHRLDIDELGYIINPNNLNELSISVIKKGLNAIDVDLTEKDVQSLISNIVGYEIECIPQQKLINGIKLRNEGFCGYSDVLPCINRLKIAFAALGTNRNELIKQFPEDKYTCERFIEEIINGGLKASVEVIRKPCKIVFGDTEELESTKIISGLFGMFDEIIITSEQEEEFNEKIKLTMTSKWTSFLEHSEILDQENSSAISLSDFHQICRNLYVSFSPTVLQYLEVLFYSKIPSTNKVPYRFFYLKYNS